MSLDDGRGEVEQRRSRPPEGAYQGCGDEGAKPPRAAATW